MFGLKFWIVAIVLFFNTHSYGTSNTAYEVGGAALLGGVFGVQLLVLSMVIFSLIFIFKKIANILKKKDENTYSEKAIDNHSKDVISGIKLKIDEYKEEHSSLNQSQQNTNGLNEDEIYEKVMIEIEEDKKVKSTWAKAVAQSDGNKDKAESIYVKLRVDVLINKQKDSYNKGINNFIIEQNSSNQDEQNLIKQEKLNKFIERYKLTKLEVIDEKSYFANFQGNRIRIKWFHEASTWKFLR